MLRSELVTGGSLLLFDRATQAGRPDQDRQDLELRERALGGPPDQRSKFVKLYGWLGPLPWTSSHSSGVRISFTPPWRIRNTSAWLKRLRAVSLGLHPELDLGRGGAGKA